MVVEATLILYVITLYLLYSNNKKVLSSAHIIETMECIVEQESDILIVGMNRNYKGNSLAIQRAQRKNKKIKA